MEDLHEIFTAFKKEFGNVYQEHEALGKTIHEQGGPCRKKCAGSSRQRSPARAAIG